MMIRLKYIAIFFPIVGSLLFSCDTSSTIDDPGKNYFMKYYGNDGDQEGVDVVVGSDGFIYMLGNTTIPGSGVGQQIYLVKTDPDGMLIWEKSIGGKFDESAKDLELSTSNQLVILANSKKGSDESDILLMTFTLDGNKVDSVLVGLKTISGEESDDLASSISQTSDGFIIAGSTTSVKIKPGNLTILPEDEKDRLHLRFSNNLTPFSSVWKQTGGTNGTDVASKVYQVSSTLFYEFGYTNSNEGSGATISDFNFYILPLGQYGDVGSGKPMYPGALTQDVLTSVITPLPGSTDGFLLAGTSEDANGNFDIYINKLRKSLLFDEAKDYQVNKPLSIDLGKPDKDKATVTAYHSSSSGYLLLANEKTTTNSNFLLTKITNDGLPAWSNPESVIFGGQKEDVIGAVSELPDGKIILIGTMSLGDEGQKKMALIKLNKEGKFLE